MFLFVCLTLFYLFIGERDTYRGNTIENWGCLFVVWTYVRHFCTLTLAFLC